MRLGWVVLVLVPLAAGAQTGAPSQPAADAAAQGLRVYRNAELGLTFAYPAELQPRAAAENEPEQPKPDACTRVLLSVATGRPAGGGGADAERGPSGSIALSSIDGSCVPAKTLKNKKAMDTLLSGMTTEGTTLLGMMPVEDPVGYALEGHHAHFAASQGQPVTANALQPADGSQVIAVIAVFVNGHILSWRLQANTLDLFNRLLGSQVDLGTGTPQALFPAQMH